MLERSLMVQGTTSNAGKSAIATGLCRLLKQRGFKVSPFKPQNMALNSAVTIDGGEIGRAQALQAQACGLEPHTDMNPILLKPNSSTGAQVIVHGKALTNMSAVEYHQFKAELMPAVLHSFHRLKRCSDVVIIEGAGSPAEINLRDNDLANMGFATAVGCPVVIVADIDRGGVFAHLAGTLALLSEEEQNLVKGFVVNKFRGDIALLKPGLQWLESHTNKPVLGVLPYLSDLYLEAEDSLSRFEVQSEAKSKEGLNVVVPLWPKISNQTDFDPLVLNPLVHLSYVRTGEAIPACDLIILPGSKSVRDDLNWLKNHGWITSIQKHLRYGGKLLGVCGGFQMLGKAIHDPHGIESQPGTSAGLGVLDMETTIETEKQLERKSGTLTFGGARVSGYEIHMGTTYGTALDRPLILHEGECDGAVSEDKQVAGTYWHGIFDIADGCRELLKWAGLSAEAVPNYHKVKEENIDRLASALAVHLDLTRLSLIMQLDPERVKSDYALLKEAMPT